MEIEDIVGIQNQIRLRVLLCDRGRLVLQKLFLGRFQSITKNAWENVSTEAKFSFMTGYFDTRALSSGQIKTLQTGDIFQWDITLLAALLIGTNKNNASLSEGMKLKLAAENASIEELRNLRNDFAHFTGKSLSSNDIDRFWSQAENLLIKLGLPKQDIDHIRTSSKLEGTEFQCIAVNKDHMSLSKSFREDGNAALRSSLVKEAIKIYSKALLLVGLSNEERGILHSNRCQAYLQLLKDKLTLTTDENEENFKKAKEDANMTIELRPSWWRGYCRVGQVEKLKNNFQPAIYWFETALSLRPDCEDARIAIYECRADLLSWRTQEHLNPSLNMNTTEILRDFRETRGTRIGGSSSTEEVIKNAKKLMKSPLPEQMAMGCTMMAQLYMAGDHVPLDVAKAVSLFTRASDAGNAVANYSLGLMYMHGEGVPRDVKLAVKLYEKAGHQQYSGDQDQDYGIGVGKYLMGRCHEEGIVYPKSYPIAAIWYQQASEEGRGDASSSLGYLHEQGLGVERNMDRAIQYWKLSAEQGWIPASNHLAWGYLKVADVHQAEIWFKRSVTSGLLKAKMEEETFKNACAARRKELEKIKGSLKGVGTTEVPTFKLVSRLMKRNAPEIVTMHNIVLDSPGKTAHPSSEENLFGRLLSREPEVRIRAMTGGRYAREIITGMECFCRAREFLLKLTSSESWSHSQRQALLEAILENLAKAAKIDSIAISPSVPEREAFFNIVSTSLRHSTDSIRHNAHVCHVYFTATDLTECLKFIELSRKRYPRDPYFCLMKSDILGFMGSHDEGARVSEEGIRLFPGEYEFFFKKAEHLRLADGGESTEEAIIEAHRSYVERAPDDHRKVPESYYTIAYMYAKRKDFAKVEHYYQKGVAAEKRLISCFLPYTSPAKKMVGSIRSLHFRIKEMAESPEICYKSLLEEDAEEVEENRQLQSTNPKRIWLLRKYRETRSRETKLREKMANGYRMIQMPITNKGLRTQQAPGRKPGKLKEITFGQMDPTTDKVYQGFFINLTVMDDPHFNIFTSADSIVKDDNGDFQMMSVYNVDHDDRKVRKGLRFGSRIRLKNPYLRLPVCDTGVIIRVDDPKSIVYVSSGDERSLCRFCWKENAHHCCPTCMQSKYCSKECLDQDRETLNHGLVCGLC